MYLKKILTSILATAVFAFAMHPAAAVAAEKDEHTSAVSLEVYSTFSYYDATDNLVKDTFEIKSATLQFENQVTLEQAFDNLFENSSDDIDSLISKKLSDLNLPEKCPENLSLIFYLNEDLDKIISCDISYDEPEEDDEEKEKLEEESDEAAQDDVIEDLDVTAEAESPEDLPQGLDNSASDSLDDSSDETSSEVPYDTTSETSSVTGENPSNSEGTPSNEQTASPSPTPCE